MARDPSRRFIARQPARLKNNFFAAVVFAARLRLTTQPQCVRDENRRTTAKVLNKTDTKHRARFTGARREVMKNALIVAVLIFSAALSIGLMRGLGRGKESLLFSAASGKGLVRGLWQGANEPPPNPEFSPADAFYIRSEPRLGCRQRTYSYSSGKDCKGQDGEEQFELAARSKVFADITRMASRLVAEHDDTTVAVTFSAMITDGGSGSGPLRLRALVDGNEADPGEITLTERQYGHAAGYSFTFIATVDKGIHTVQMQWSSTMRSATSLLRDASLLVTVDSQDNAGQRLVAKARKPPIPLTKNSLAWTKIPQTDLDFNVPEKGGAAFVFASVSKMKQGNYFQVRAVVDDAPYLASPGASAFTIETTHKEARSLTFTTKELSPGLHKVHFEWQSAFTDVMSEVELEAWTATALTNKGLTVIPQGVPFNVTQDVFTEVPTLATEIQVNELSDVAVTFSGVGNGYSEVYATVMKDGNALGEQASMLYHPDVFIAPGQTNPTSVSNRGAQSFTFALKDLPPREKPYRISVALRLKKAGPGWSNRGTLVSNATMTVLRKHRIGPDLAVGANVGAASRKHEAIIEPVYGRRKVLAVVFDPKRSDAVPVNGAYMQGVDDMLFGPVPSAKDYYRVVSGGRLQLDKVAVLGPYSGDKGAIDPTKTNHYWDGAGHGCPGVDEYNSPYKEQIVEALKKASDEFDFSEYDFDRNGILTAKELAIVVVVPQNKNFGETTSRFDPYCGNNNPFVVDGVEIHEVTHLYTPGTVSTPQEPNGPLASAMVAAHELAHLVLQLDDTYGPVTGVFQNNGDLLPCPSKSDPTCQTRYVNTAPHAISMMSHITQTRNGDASSPHLDGFHKLQLGWVTPRLVVNPGAYHQYEVQQSGEVLILPREGTDAREYLLLETRYETNGPLDARYDYNLMDSGLAVYHVIEPGSGCQSSVGASPLSCAPLQKPMCIASDLLWGTFASNLLRPGLRLIQPDMQHTFNPASGGTNFSETLFGANPGQDLLDGSGGGGMSCAPNIGLPGTVPQLIWVDGSASGYQLKGIKTDFAGQRTLFNIGIAGK
ncbi:MAG: hypothetical protein HOP19_05770 [Acidobacteria bacterium]|nr:hypothetical protein [Acidobacteriota bacterium]